MGKAVLFISTAYSLSAIDKIFQVTNTEDICQQYIGLEFKAKGRKRWACCPVHNEKTPSLCLYLDGKLYCYGCQFKGDGLDLIGKVLDLPLPEVLKIVSADYGLVNDYDVDQRREISQKIITEQRQREQVKEFNKQVDDSYKYLTEIYRNFIKIERSITSINDLDRDDMAMAFELTPIIDGIMDLLSDSNIDMQYKGLQWGRRLNLW